MTVQLGNGDGTFEPGQAVAVGPAPTAVAVADFNGDGRPDLVTDQLRRQLRERAPGQRRRHLQRAADVCRGPQPADVVVADLTGDGIPDLIVANYNDDTVSVLLGKGDGTFLPQEVFPVGDKPYSLARGRLDWRRPRRHHRRQLGQRHRERAPEPGREQELCQLRAADHVPHRQAAVFGGRGRPHWRRHRPTSSPPTPSTTR